MLGKIPIAPIHAPIKAPPISFPNATYVELDDDDVTDLIREEFDPLRLLPTCRLCKSCKKNLEEAHFDEGKKTCRTCLHIHRAYMRRKRRREQAETGGGHGGG
tara:strand:- start:3659 stop:3967 length:309 start_codon:yes stop_codon:yes gene_type:complete